MRPKPKDWDLGRMGAKFTLLRDIGLTTAGLGGESFIIYTNIENLRLGDRICPTEDDAYKENSCIVQGDEDDTIYRVRLQTLNKNIYLHPKFGQKGTEWVISGGSLYSETKNLAEKAETQ